MTVSQHEIKYILFWSCTNGAIQLGYLNSSGDVKCGYDTTVTSEAHVEAKVALSKLKMYQGLVNIKKTGLHRFLVYNNNTTNGELKSYITPGAVWYTEALFGHSTFGSFAEQRTRTQDYVKGTEGEHNWCPGRPCVNLFCKTLGKPGKECCFLACQWFTTAHSVTNRILHRDVSAGNILITEEGARAPNDCKRALRKSQAETAFTNSTLSVKISRESRPNWNCAQRNGSLYQYRIYEDLVICRMNSQTTWNRSFGCFYIRFPDAAMS
ncbi:hypothetical protein B0F90DRAFT_1669731 [Multifurca ochricompacta]|uniref:Uncharacterized protein n=1 Tax=Multifurca ochricompacta TaxID=376703 RepID=A0AAD4QLK6_9AGAM|nr:hypothetical protein B0F90DRAFT_1669731 [Multifurca ochricompacta]